MVDDRNALMARQRLAVDVPIPVSVGFIPCEERLRRAPFPTAADVVDEPSLIVGSEAHTLNRVVVVAGLTTPAVTVLLARAVVAAHPPGPPDSHAAHDAGGRTLHGPLWPRSH